MRKIKVLITGVTGFLGSNLLKELCTLQYDVIAIKRSSSRVDNIIGFKEDYRTYNIDEVTFEYIFEIEDKIDAVIHCATDYGRRKSDPRPVIMSNVIFPVELLYTAVNRGTKLFINADTSLSKLKIVEGYMENYILSKKQFLDWGRLYAESNRITFVNLVLEHFYGPGDDKSKFIAFLIDSFRNDLESVDLTLGEQLRDFIYIKDVVSAFLAILEYKNQLESYSEYEVGTGVEVKVKDVVKLVKELTGAKTTLNFGAISYRKNEVMSSKANTSKLEELGWKPLYSIETGLRKYLEEY